MYAASRLGRKTGRTLIIETKNERKECYWVVGSDQKDTKIYNFIILFPLLGTPWHPHSRL